MRYNCTILNLHRRKVVTSITDRHITDDLAIRTLKKALSSQPNLRGDLILHSDRNSQFTSRAFVEFCQAIQITQSMSSAGCPYDNAPIERYFNTLKHACTNLRYFQTEDELYKEVKEFSYVTYNYLRPHSFNNYQPPCRIVEAL